MKLQKLQIQKKKDFAKRKSVLVGTNMYANPKEEVLEIKVIDLNAIYKKRVEYIQKYKMFSELVIIKKHSSTDLKNYQNIADQNLMI